MTRQAGARGESAHIGIESLERRVLLHGDLSVHVSFQPAALPLVDGYVADSGQTYGDRGNGLVYGWDVDNTHNAHIRRAKQKLAPDLRYTTDVLSFAAKHKKGGHAWQIELPNDTYTVHIVDGDGSTGWGRAQVIANGVLVVDGKATRKSPWVQNTATVAVTNGILSISNGPKSRMNKLAFIDIEDAGTGGAPSPAPEPDPNPNPSKTINWHNAASSPIARAEAQSAVVNGKLYVLGGYYITNPSYQGTTRCDVYNPATNSWARIADMPQPVTHAGVAAVGTDIWIAGGYPTLPNGQQHFATTSVYKYDTLTNTWSAGPSLPDARGAGVMVAVGHTLHFISGVNASRVDQTEHWALNLDNPSAGWTTAAPLPSGRNHVAAVPLNGKIYVIGGQLGTNDATGAQSTVFVYNIASDSWSRAADLPFARSHITDSTFAWNGRIVVAGGVKTGDIPVADVNLYDPATNTWTAMTSLPAARHSPIANYVAGRFVVTTGYLWPGLQSTTWMSDAM